MKNFDLLKDRNRALVLGDIHGNFEAFGRAVAYASMNDLFIVSLGDLTDYGHDNYDCVSLMSDMVNADRAAMVIGNHDMKLFKYFQQREEGDIRIQVNRGLATTIAEFDEMSDYIQDAFIEAFRNVFDSARFHYVTKNTMFVHGAAHRKFWETDALNSKGRARALYGQVGGFTEANYPIREYDWADEVRPDRTVFFGHDIRSTESITTLGANQNVFSMDTGSSKTGKLSGAVVEYDGTKFIITEEKRFDK